MVEIVYDSRKVENAYPINTRILREVSQASSSLGRGCSQRLGARERKGQLTLSPLAKLLPRHRFTSWTRSLART